MIENALKDGQTHEENLGKLAEIYHARSVAIEGAISDHRIHLAWPPSTTHRRNSRYIFQ